MTHVNEDKLSGGLLVFVMVRTDTRIILQKVGLV